MKVCQLRILGPFPWKKSLRYPLDMRQQIGPQHQPGCYRGNRSFCPYWEFDLDNPPGSYTGSLLSWYSYQNSDYISLSVESLRTLVSRCYIQYYVSYLHLTPAPWMVEEPRIDSRHVQHIFLLSTASRLALGPNQLPFQWVPQTFPLGVKWLWCEANCSAPSNVGRGISPLSHTPSWCGT
jgi:hypothetical protein